MLKAGVGAAAGVAGLVGAAAGGLAAFNNRRANREEEAGRQREEEMMARRQRYEEERAKRRREKEEEEEARRQRLGLVAGVGAAVGVVVFGAAAWFNNRRKAREEEARRQREEEKARRQREEEEKAWLGLLVVCSFVVCLIFSYYRGNIMSSDPVQEKSVNLMTETYQRHVMEQYDQSEQTGREQKKNSQQAEQTGGDQGDDERDDEDKERDQEEEESDREEETEEEESDSEEETEEEESDSEDSISEDSYSDEETDDDDSYRLKKKRKQTCKKKRKKPTMNQCEINQASPGMIRLGLLNVNSMNPRTSRISELITGNNLDVLLTTETKLRDDTADRVLSEASPEGFRFHSQVRTDGRRGGGVAIQFSERLQGERIHFDLNIETFEFVVTVVQRNDWDQPVVIINLYHPPGYDNERFRRFLNEFQSLLDEVKKKYSSIIVTGDFNIRPKKGKRSFTDEFYFLLLVNNLTQHVEGPTHVAGNTLDLVITSNVEISGVFVRDDRISDHYTVYYNVKPKDTEENENEAQKRFRKTEE